MIKLINNEYNKIGKVKLLFSILLFIIIIVIIKETSNNISNTIFTLIPFIGISTIILFGGTISSEIENGTFRYYLTKPYKRWKIYLSKYLSIVIYVAIVSITIFLMYYIICNNINNVFLLKYLKYLIPLWLMSGVLIFISSIIKNTSFTIGISIFIITFSPILSQILFGIGFTYIEYTFLPYLDFTLFNDVNYLSQMNEELNINLNLNIGIIIDIIYTIVLYLIGNYIFIKKDINN